MLYNFMAQHDSDNCVLCIYFFIFIVLTIFLSYRLKKNLKMFIIVHPSWFIRTLLGITRPFIRFQPPPKQLLQLRFTSQFTIFFYSTFYTFLNFMTLCFLQHQVQQQDQVCEQPTGAGTDYSTGAYQHSSQHCHLNDTNNISLIFLYSVLTHMSNF